MTNCPATLRESLTILDWLWFKASFKNLVIREFSLLAVWETCDLSVALNACFRMLREKLMRSLLAS